MIRTIRKLSVMGMAGCLSIGLGWGKEANDTSKPPIKVSQTLLRADVAPREPAVRGKPLSYWLRCLKGCGEESRENAIDAIIEFGPEASQAVPELTRIVSEPFVAIKVGMDPEAVVKTKLLNIELRANAVDALAVIGEAAAPSAQTLIQWALTLRVVPPVAMKPVDDADERLFINLIGIDVLERMRVAGAIAEFGPLAAPVIIELLQSGDDEKRRLAVAILNEAALPIAAHLLKSPNCHDRSLGFAILVDMSPVVAKEHFVNLRSMLPGCDSD